MMRGLMPCVAIDVPDSSPPPPDRRNNRIEVRIRLEKLEGRRSLAGDDHGIVIRMDEACAGRTLHFGTELFAGRNIRRAKMYLGAEPLDVFDLDLRRVVRHHDMRRNAPLLRGVGERRAVIAGRMRHHARRGLLGDNENTALHAPRALKAPTFCRFSHLRNSVAPRIASSECDVKTGVTCT
jgi:hypothetical protein